MKRGELDRVRHPSSRDPKRSRVFVVVTRQVVIDSKISTVVCAPIYSRYDGLSTQVPVGVEEGLKYASTVHCDELISLVKSVLTDYVGELGRAKLAELRRALRIALAVND